MSPSYGVTRSLIGGESRRRWPGGVMIGGRRLELTQSEVLGRNADVVGK